MISSCYGPLSIVLTRTVQFCQIHVLTILYLKRITNEHGILQLVKYDVIHFKYLGT